MNRRTATILLVAIVVLGGIVFYLNANPELTAEPTPTSATLSEPLWTIDPSQIAAITVTDTEKQTTFKASLDPGGLWQVTEPQEGEADPTRMSTVTSTIGSLYISRRVADVVNLADFGLAAPQYAIEIKLSDGTTFSATVGDKAVGGYMYYVLPQGSTQPVLVGTASLDTLLSLPNEPPLVTPTPVTIPPTQEPLPTQPVPGTPSP